MNQEQEKNLDKLAIYLKVGNLQTGFDMLKFREAGHEYKAFCGSVGCAIGHGPHAGVRKELNENWTNYAKRVFGVDLYEGNTFAFLFSCEWQRFDNTPEGAADRINYFLEKGLPEEVKEMDCCSDKFFETILTILPKERGIENE